MEFFLFCFVCLFCLFVDMSSLLVAALSHLNAMLPLHVALAVCISIESGSSFQLRTSGARGTLSERAWSPGQTDRHTAMLVTGYASCCACTNQYM
jgi:hypothetical protein